MRGETKIARGPSRWRRVLVGVVLAVLLARAQGATAAQGVRGRASLGGTLVEGLTVRAYPHRPGSFGPWTGTRPAGEAVTGTDGTYHIELPPGQYVVEGLKKRDGRVGPRPESGDLWCMYAGSPVTVSPGSWTAVGLNLVQVPPETRTTEERTRFKGTITFDGEPAEKVYLYLYQDLSSAFRGPARLLKPVPKGRFNVRVPPGTYYLVARKRMAGGPYGPLEIGDRFNFYAGNPVTVDTGEAIEVAIPLVERLSQLEEDPETYRGLPVRVVGADGAGRAGFHVLVYDSPMRAGPPRATTAPTDDQGRTHLFLPRGQTLYLRARKTLGGPLTEGEVFGDAELPDEGGDEVQVVVGAPR